MNRFRPYILAAGGAALFLVLTLLFTLIFVPAESVRGILARGLEREGYFLTTGSFTKVYPLGLRARKLEIADVRGPLLRMDEARVTFSVPALLTGKKRVDFDGKLGAGVVEGSFTPGTTGGALAVRVSDLKLEDVPFFRTATGGDIRGTFRGNASFSGLGPAMTGDLQAEVKQAEVADLKIGEFPLPSSSYPSVRAKIGVKNGRGTVESLTFEGEGVFARIKGDMTFAQPLGSTPLNLTLELLPKPDFLEKQKLIFLLLAKFTTAPGRYEIPIRGTLGKPAAL